MCQQNLFSFNKEMSFQGHIFSNFKYHQRIIIKFEIANENVCEPELLKCPAHSKHCRKSKLCGGIRFFP